MPEAMEKKYQKVDWHAYAEKYDMLLEYNPFYQQLRREIFATVKEWTFEDEACILDIGAGTGNYSVLLAGHFPNAKVIHLDNNPAMNGRAGLKKREYNLVNLDIMDRGIEEVDFPENSMQGPCGTCIAGSSRAGKVSWWTLAVSSTSGTGNWP